jgi:DHA2 family multidrug resistance protein-like MFS transporter
VYRAHLDIPAGTPTEAADAAGQGITAATAAAQHLPGALGADLLAAARTAFAEGLTTVAGIGAAVFIGLALLTALAFRHVAVTGTAPEPPAADEPLHPRPVPATVPA